jgi:hypothetical protein
LEEKPTDSVAAPVVASLDEKTKSDDVQDLVPSTKIPSPGGSRKAVNESNVRDKSSASLQLSVSADDDLPAVDESSASLQLSVSADDNLPVGDESKQSTELSVSADDDLPSTETLVEEADKSKIPPAAADDAVPSVSGGSTSTEESDGETIDPSYPPPLGLANTISQSQATVPPAVPIEFPSPIRSTRKEIKYWSANLEKPYFVHKTDPFEFPHDRFPAHPGHQNHFQPSKIMWKQYDDYFAKLKTNPLPEGQIVARVRHNTVNVAQLNSMAPNTWLFGTILSAYLDLLGNEVYVQNEEDKNPPKMAVFDNIFLDNISDWTDEYSYKNARASAMKRL